MKQQYVITLSKTHRGKDYEKLKERRARPIWKWGKGSMGRLGKQTPFIYLSGVSLISGHTFHT
jgi:hypothetical protein